MKTFTPEFKTQLDAKMNQVFGYSIGPAKPEFFFSETSGGIGVGEYEKDGHREMVICAVAAPANSKSGDTAEIHVLHKFWLN